MSSNESSPIRIKGAYPLLQEIGVPRDLRALPEKALGGVCSELRDYILEVLSQVPGHLGSSLGAVELTVALHYVYRTPYDRIVWDVGHQAYAHKILTGRREQFVSLRQWGGLSGFPNPGESVYDTFPAGHASNSVSAALGMAVAAELKGEQRQVIAVIGDGAMTGGLAFEALNNVTGAPNNLLIIINDNNMSIDANVGGLNKYLVDLNTSHTYNTVRYDLYRGLRKMGLINDSNKRNIQKVNNGVKSFFAPSRQLFFDGFGIRYFGPIDGNNVDRLVYVLQKIKTLSGPKILHIRTTKGYGYKPAMELPSVWHAPGKFDVATGKRLSAPKDKHKPPKFQEVFGHTITEFARADERITGITPAMPSGSSLNIMMKEFPGRTYDVGIAEEHAVTFSAGLAKEGLIPFCNIYSSFAQRAFDQIIHDVALPRFHVIFCLDRAGLVGEDGATHQGAYDLAALRAVPNLIISAPINEHYLRHLMYTAYKGQEGPMVIRYPRGEGSEPDWQIEPRLLPIGKGRCLREPDPDVAPGCAILTLGVTGITVQRLLDKHSSAPEAFSPPPTEEAEKGRIKNSLDADQISLSSGSNDPLIRAKSIGHYDLIFLKPLDEDLLREVFARYPNIITIEEGTLCGGFGSAVAEVAAREHYTGRLFRLGIPDEFIPQGTVAQQRAYCGIDEASIEAFIRTHIPF